MRRGPGVLSGGLVATGLAAVAVATAVLVAGCGSSGPAFHPGGAAATDSATSAAQSGAGQLIMPSFGSNTHVVMTSWLPKNASLARAVLTDKNYELAYLYAEYTGGQDDSWSSYVNSAMQAEISEALSAASVTSESFKGTIRIFDMSVAHDAINHADVDVTGCFDNAQALNTSRSTGTVLPGQTVSDANYYRYTDELAPAAGGTWQVIGSYQHVDYPQAKECKP